MSTGRPARSPMAIASLMDSKTPVPSLRMCDEKMPPCLRDYLAKLHQVIGRRQRAPGGMAEQRGKAEGAVLHGVVEDRLHPGELFLSRAGVRLAHHRFPDVFDADVRGDVDGDAGLFQHVEIAAQRRPFCGLALHDESLLRQFAEVGPGRVLFSQYFGRDPIVDLALGVAVFEQDHVRMRVHVDKSGRDDQPPGVDLAFRAARRGPRPTATMRSPSPATSP